MSAASSPDAITPPSEDLRARLLDAMLEIAPFEGWTRAGVDAAARAAGLTPAETMLAAPKGVSELLTAFADRADAEAAALIAKADLAEMKVRDRIRFAVKTRIETLSPHKEAARRAAEAAAAPWRAGLGPRLLWRTVDRIWIAVGDTSTDYNWYSKRAILSGVVAATLAAWFDADDPEKAWRRLDAHIDKVMQFEKAKARAQKWTLRAPNPLDILGRTRRI